MVMAYRYEQGCRKPPGPCDLGTDRGVIRPEGFSLGSETVRTGSSFGLQYLLICCRDCPGQNQLAEVLQQSRDKDFLRLNTLDFFNEQPGGSSSGEGMSPEFIKIK